MRGKVAQAVTDVSGSRITPAYAGKSAICVSAPLLFRDHPRVCGEKELALAVLGAEGGSPPRMRGKDEGNDGGTKSLGITPAYAGKSSR